MRLRALPLAPLVLLALAVPASAQGTEPSPSDSASPSPDRTVCPNISFVHDPRPVPPHTPVTMAFGSDVQPARVPERWTVTRLSPGPEEVVHTVLRSATATYTVDVAVTTTFRVSNEGAEGCEPVHAVFTRTVSHGSPAPTPDAVDRPCSPFDVEVSRPSAAGGVTTVVATPHDRRPFRGYRVRLTRTSPGPAVVVRDVAATGTVPTTFALRLGESHRFLLEAFSTGRDDFCLPAWSAPVEAHVRPVLTLAAVRSGLRSYAFTGRVLPGRGQTVDLHRVQADGRRVLTARTTVRPDGTYRIDRRFLGSGRSGFEVRVGASSTHLAGASPVRPTVVH